MRNSSARVAIVDDDPSVRKALARLLGISSFEAETFQSAHDFLGSLQSRTPHCLIVDLQMPGMNGLELQHHLARTGISIPTIVVTGHDGPGFREQCQAAGALAYLQKPLDASCLVAAIKSAMQRD